MQPSQQHVAPCVKVVEWEFGTRGLRLLAAFWAGIPVKVTQVTFMQRLHAVEVLPSGHPYSRLIRHAGKQWTYSTPQPQGE